MGNNQRTQPPEVVAPAPMPPAVYLLLWQVGCQGMPEPAEMEAVGLNEAGVRKIIEQYPEEFVELRRMVKITQLMDLHTLGALLRSRLMSQLAQATKPSDVAQLTNAAKSLPAWALPIGGTAYAPGTSGGTAYAAVASPDATDNGGSLIDGALEAELNRIRKERGQQPLNRQQRRARDARKRGK